MLPLQVTMLLTMPENRGFTKNRDHSTKFIFEADGSQIAAAMQLAAFPDFSVIEGRFTLVQVGGKEVSRPVEEPLVHDQSLTTGAMKKAKRKK